MASTDESAGIVPVAKEFLTATLITGAPLPRATANDTEYCVPTTVVMGVEMYPLPAVAFARETINAKLPVEETLVRLSAEMFAAAVQPVVANSNVGFVTRFVS